MLVMPVDENVAPVRKPVAGFEERDPGVYRFVDEKGYLGVTPNDRLHFLQRLWRGSALAIAT
jgi:hypothetical protein